MGAAKRHPFASSDKIEVSGTPRRPRYVAMRSIALCTTYHFLDGVHNCRGHCRLLLSYPCLENSPRLLSLGPSMPPSHFCFFWIFWNVFKRLRRRAVGEFAPQRRGEPHAAGRRHPPLTRVARAPVRHKRSRGRWRSRTITTTTTTTTTATTDTGRGTTYAQCRCRARAGILVATPCQQQQQQQQRSSRSSVSRQRRSPRPRRIAATTRRLAARSPSCWSRLRCW